jgi:putative membrane protein
MGQGMMGYGTHGYGGIFMVLFGLLLIAGIVMLIVWLFRHFAVGHDKGGTPLDILKKKYANGEINKEEFEQKKRDLM